MSEANGTAPAGDAPPAAAEPCVDCVTGGEKIMAVIAAAVAIGLALMAIDLLTGGKAWAQFKTAAAIPQEPAA
jgi:hypothetical protein